jgi:hypothetical protein
MHEDNENAKEHVLQKLLLALGSMGSLIVKKELKGSGVYKNDVLFCLVDGDDVYFNPGKYGNLYFMDKTVKLLKNKRLIVFFNVLLKVIG